MSGWRYRLVLAVTVVLVVAAVFVVRRGDREVSAPPPGERAVPGLAARLGDLAWLRLSRGRLRVNLALINGRWAVVEKGNYPADGERVRKLLLALADLTLVEPKTERAALLPRLDLDDPANGKSTLVTLQVRTGEVAGALIIGRRRPTALGGGSEGVYVRRPGSDRAWLARGSFDLSGDLGSWLDHRIVDIPAARVATVVLTAPEGNSIVLTRASPGAPFVLDGAPAGTTPDAAALAAPAGMLAGFNLVDVRPATEMPPAPGGATAALTTFDGVTIGLRLAPSKAGDWISIDATGFGGGEAEANALSARLSHWSFMIAPETAKLLRAGIADLVKPRGS